MIVVFQGAESIDHRRTLESTARLFDERPPIVVGISYKSLRVRKLGGSYVDDTAALFPVVLEAGISQSDMDKDQAAAFAHEYYEFAASVSSVSYIIQPDHHNITDLQVPDDKRIIPVLFDQSDPDMLKKILGHSGSVAMVYTGDKRVPAVLRKYSDPSTLALALSQPDLAFAHKAGFNACMTQAWVAPARYGEISIWDGSKFHRASNVDRDRLVSKYETQIIRAGLDIDLVRDNDAKETNRLAAYSLIEWAKTLPEGVSDTKEETATPNGANREIASTKPSVKSERGTIPLPVFYKEIDNALEEDLDGTSTIRSREILRASSATVRVCDSCFLSSTCPAYEQGASCAFSLPIEVRTDVQVKALLHSIVEMQVARVAFARFAEEVNGGYPDPVVGKEMDRLVRITDRVRRSEEKRERLTVSVEAESHGGGSGVLSSIFGNRAAVQPDPETLVTKILEGELSDLQP